MPFTGAQMSPQEAADVREAVARERTTDVPFDVCVWGSTDRADEYEAAGVTWLVQGASPEDDLGRVSRRIAEGPGA
jgi:hypothetical protein